MSDNGRGSRNAQASTGKTSPKEAQMRANRADQLRPAAADTHILEGDALALLEIRDLPPGVLDALAGNREVMKRRKVQIALACHPQTPRHVSLPLVRHLYTFELLRIAMLPSVASDLKVTVEDAVISRLETITSGERMVLARQGTTRLAAALLKDPDARVMAVALTNPRMTEAALIKSVTSAKVSAKLVQALCSHPKWSVRRELQMALLRNENTPLAKAIQFAQQLPIASVKEVLQVSKLPENVRKYLTELVEQRIR